MKRMVTWGIVGVALVAMLSHVTAQGEERFPEPLPLSPDTSKFYFFGTHSVSVAVSCSQAVKEAHGGSSGERPYASNNPADPCASADEPAGTARGNFRAVAPTFGAIDVPIMPIFPTDLPMDTSVSMTGEFVLYFEPLNAPVNFGAVKPKVSLIVGETTIASWDGAGEVVDEFEAPQAGDIAVRFEFDLGAAPESLPKGAAKIEIDFENSVSADEQELRAIGQRFVLSVKEDTRGHVILPFTADAGNSFPSEEEPEEDAGNETDNETVEDDNMTSGNETGNETVPTPTNTTATNNTTAPTTEESGFLPGFEVVGVVSASLIALAYVVRERRRPPVQTRR